MNKTQHLPTWLTGKVHCEPWGKGGDVMAGIITASPMIIHPRELMLRPVGLGWGALCLVVGRAWTRFCTCM